jgi:hypothetical protein
LGDGDKEASESVVEVAGRDVSAGKIVGDFFADVVGGEGLGFFASVEEAEVRMAGAARHAALMAAGESEGAEPAIRIRTRGRGNFILTQVGRNRGRRGGHPSPSRSSGHRSLRK